MTREPQNDSLGRTGPLDRTARMALDLDRVFSASSLSRIVDSYMYSYFYLSLIHPQIRMHDSVLLMYTLS